jgi:hypothetical protein
LTWQLYTRSLGANDAGNSDTGVFVNLAAESTAYHANYKRKGGTNGNGGTMTVRSFALNGTLHQTVGT